MPNDQSSEVELRVLVPIGVAGRFTVIVHDAATGAAVPLKVVSARQLRPRAQEGNK